MFKRQSYEQISVGEERYTIPVEVYKYIINLRRENSMLNDENLSLMKDKHTLTMELDDIKTVINDPKYEPALSRDCGDCKYVARGRWNGSIIGCRKNNVCADFVKGEEDD